METLNYSLNCWGINGNNEKREFTSSYITNLIHYSVKVLLPSAVLVFNTLFPLLFQLCQQLIYLVWSKHTKSQTHSWPTCPNNILSCMFKDNHIYLVSHLTEYSCANMVQWIFTDLIIAEHRSISIPPAMQPWQIITFILQRNYYLWSKNSSSHSSAWI